MVDVQIKTEDGRTERLTVTRVGHYTQEYDDGSPHEVGDEFWVLEGLDPYDTDLISSDYVWLSGSLGDPRDLPEGRFPLVYVPKDDGLTVTVLEE